MPIRSNDAYWISVYKAKGYQLRHDAAGVDYFYDPADPGNYIIKGQNPARGWSRVPREYIDGYAPKSPAQTVESYVPAEDRLLTVPAAGGRQAWHYGQVAYGGDIFYASSTDPNLYLGIAFGRGEIDSVVSWTCYGKDSAVQLATGLLAMNFHMGTVAPAVDALYQAAAGLGAGAEVFPGLAYGFGKFTYWWSSDFVSFPTMRFILKGRKVYDPRTTLTVWSDNPALCLADYIVNAMLQTVDWPSVTVAADYCDVLVGGEKRHRFNLSFIRPTSHRAVIDTIRAHFKGVVFRRDGNYVIKVKSNPAPSLTLDGTNSAPMRALKKDSDAIPNRVIVHYTDPLRDYQDTLCPAAETAGVKAGTEYPIPLEVYLPGCTTASEAYRMAWYILNDGLADLEIDVAGTKLDSLALEPADVLTYTSTAVGVGPASLQILSVEDQIDSRIFHCKQNVAIGDTTALVETKVPSSLPTPLAVLGNPTGLTLTEEVYATPQTATAHSRIRVNFTPVQSVFLGATEVTVQRGSGVIVVLGLLVGLGAQVAYVENADDLVQITVTAKSVNSTTGTKSSGATAVLTPAGDPGTAPPSPIPVDRAGLWWLPSRDRIRNTYGATYWSATNLPSFTAAKVNDGDLTATAFMLNTTGAASLNFDAGVGNAIAVREVRYSTGAFLSILFLKLQWSDDNVTYTDADAGAQSGIYATGWRMYDTVNLYADRYIVFADNGSHRYWRYAKIDTLLHGSITINEIQFVTYGAVASYVAKYRIYDVTAGWAARVLWAEIDAKNIPTAATPIDYAPLAIKQAGNSYSSYRVAVVAVSSRGVESDEPVWVGYNTTTEHMGGLWLGTGLYLDVPGVLANGLNSNISTTIIPATTNKAVLSGPTAAFSIGGIAGGADGRTLALIYTGSQVLTIKNEETGSTAANRLTTGGGDIISSAGVPFTVNLRYDTVMSRWIVYAPATFVGQLAVIQAPAVIAGNFGLRGAKFQTFYLQIWNTAGVLQHRISGTFNAGVTPLQADKINGASSVLANTPTVTGAVGFTSGAGLYGGNLHHVILDTADQAAIVGYEPMPIIVYGTTGVVTLPTVSAILLSANVNGVTRNRPHLVFYTNAGVAWLINVANIPAGTTLVVQVRGDIL